MATTGKGYPYPVGTDRVMDGDDAIRALAEAVDDDANYSRATTVGQALPADTLTAVQWNAASPDGADLTKTSATVWTVTRAGLYVISATAVTTGFSTAGTRAMASLTAGGSTARAVWAGENQAIVTLAVALAVGDTIAFSVIGPDSTNIAAGSGYLNVCRLGRT